LTCGLAAVVLSVLALIDQQTQTRATEQQVLPFIDVTYADRREDDGSITEVLAVSNYGAPLRDLNVKEVVIFHETVGQPPQLREARFIVDGYRFMGQPYFHREGLLYTREAHGNQTQLAKLERQLLEYATAHNEIGLLEKTAFVEVSYLDAFGHRHVELYKDGVPSSQKEVGTAFADDASVSFPRADMETLNLKRLLALVRS